MNFSPFSQGKKMMKKSLLAIALLMFLMGFAYGQHRQCNTYESSCSFEVMGCMVLRSTCPTGQCGNPDQAGCCLIENGYCNFSGIYTSTVVCGNSCNP
jgi:hypothetical protein